MNAPGVELLRGIPLEGTPVRVGREAGSAGLQRERPPTAQDSGIRSAYDAGWKQGHEEGFDAGHAEGLGKGSAEAVNRARAAAERVAEEARAPLQQREERLRALAGAMSAAAADGRESLEDDLVALCYEAVCHVLGKAALSREGVRSHVEDVLSKWESPGIELHVHPQDAELLLGLGIAQQREGLRCVADAEIALGGCVVVSRGGGLDARLETALERCRTALLDQRAHRSRREGEAA